MGQKQGILGKKGHLKEHEGQAYKPEIHQGVQNVPLFCPSVTIATSYPLQKEKRNQNEHPTRQSGLHQCGYDKYIAQFHHGEPLPLKLFIKVRRLVPAKEMGEVGPVIRGWRDIKGIVTEKCLCIGPNQGFCALMIIGKVLHIISIRLGGLHAGIKDQVKISLSAEYNGLGDILRREGLP